MLNTGHQSVLDDLYWNSSRTLRSIAEELGITPQQCTDGVSPFPTGFSCWWCRREIVFRRRSERVNAGRHLTHLRCSCGAVQPRASEARGLVDSGATILVPVRNMQITYETSTVLDDGIEALARCGLRWTGNYVAVEVTAPPTGIRSLLAGAPEQTVVVPELRHLATNDGDALAVFVNLVVDGWRVITSAGLHGTSYRRTAGWFAEDLLGEAW